MKTLLFFLTLLVSSQVSAQFTPESDPRRGMYIDKFLKTSLSSNSKIDTAFSILGVDADFDGVFEKEDSILRYASENHITYLSIYDLHKVFGRPFTMWDENLKADVDLEEHLVRFMRKAKSKYGVTQLGAIGGSESFFDSLSNFLDRHPLADFDVVNIEHEFWTNCPNEYLNYISIQNAMYNMKESYNLSHPANPIISEAYLAALFTCNSSYGTQNVVETIDGCTACSPCTTCTNPHPRMSDRSLYAWYITDPGSMSIAEQNVFELPSTADSTDFHPILYSESFNTGGTANFTGVWFPLSPANNIFTAEESYYKAWRNNPAVAFGTARQNNVQPGAVHWFTSTNMVGHLDQPQILQNTGPYCSSGSQALVTFNYYGPIETGIAYEFWISRDDDSTTAYPLAGGKVNGISGVYQPLTSLLPLIKNINFSDTLVFKPCYLPAGNYTAHLVLHYNSPDGNSYQCDNPVIIDTKPRIEINGPSEFCEGRYTYLKVNSTGGTINWFRNGLQIPGTGSNLQVTADGDYSCTITGGSGCAGVSDTIHVHVLSNPSIAVNAFCNANGTVTLKTNLNDPDSTSTELSGPGGVFYRWNTGDSTDQITFTPSTTNTVYRVNVSNPYSGCMRTGQISIKSPLVAPYPASITVVNQPGSSCSSNGTLMANHFNSGGPTSYLWSNGETTRTITNVPPGNYSVTMNVWASGCSSYANALVGTAPSNSPVVQEIIQNVTCKGKADGSIQLNVTGGNPPFTYFWETFPDDSVHQRSTKNQNSLYAGTYRVRITDSGSCNYYFEYIINTTHTPPEIQSISTTPVNGCANSLNGTASIVAVAGTAPYAYLWNDSQQQTSSTATSLPAGSVQITVTDANACQVKRQVQIPSTERPLQVELIDSSKSMLSCLSTQDAQLYVRISGGTQAYSVSGPWIADSNFAMLSGLNEGVYPIIITDMNGCMITDSFSVVPPEEIRVYSSSTSTTCIGCPNGSFYVSFTGGQAPYQISWSAGIGALAGNRIENLPGGIYSICVTDNNSCMTCIQDTIEESNIGLIELDIDNFLSVYPNPYSSFTTIALTNRLIQSGELIIISTDGKAVMKRRLTPDPLILFQGDLNPGLYFIRLMNDKGELLSGLKKLVVVE